MRPQARDACDTLNPDKAALFTAPDEEMAVKGFWPLAEAAGRAHDATADFSLQCRWGADITPAQCADELATLKRENIGEIARCDSPETGDGDPIDCLAIFSRNGGIDMRIYAKGYGKAVKIVRIVMDRVVTIADPRAD